MDQQTPLHEWLGLTPEPSGIPIELQAIPQWVLWKAETVTRNGSTAVNKIPWRATGPDSPASSTDPATWSDYESALASWEEAQDEFAGVGLVLTEANGLTGLDFDHCVDTETGEVHPAVQAALAALRTYCELSPSGTGVRAIIRCPVVLERHKVTAAENGVCTTEAYTTGRFLTITGRRLSQDPVATVTVDQFKHAMATLMPSRKNGSGGDKPGQNGASFDMIAAFRRVLTAESLHDQITPMAASLAAQGMPRRAAEALIEALLQEAERHDPARAGRVRGSELWRIVQSAYEKFQRQDEPPSDEPSTGNVWGAPVDVSAFVSTDPPDMRWLIDQRIQAGRGIVLTGVGGSSKSRFLYHLAAGVATGTLPWDWAVTQTGKAVLVMTEDTAEDVHRVVHWTAASLPDDQRQAFQDNLVVFALAGEHVTLLARVGGVMVETENAHKLEAMIQALGDVRLVAIDPALGITEGDELDQAHQRALGRYIDNLAVRTGAAVVLVTHAAKSLTNADEIGSHSSRGAGALTDAVRAEFVLRTMTEDEAGRAGILDVEERKSMVQLVAAKGNHLPPVAYVPLWLKRGDHGSLSQANIELGPKNPGHIGRKVANATAALEALQDICREHVPTLGEWRDKLEARGVIDPDKAEEARKKEMQRIKNFLFDEGEIVKGMGRNTWMPAPKYGDKSEWTK